MSDNSRNATIFSLRTMLQCYIQQKTTTKTKQQKNHFIFCIHDFSRWSDGVFFSGCWILMRWAYAELAFSQSIMNSEASETCIWIVPRRIGLYFVDCVFYHVPKRFTCWLYNNIWFFEQNIISVSIWMCFMIKKNLVNILWLI